eukprot:TRINITY_DN3199_c0_g1_i2.p1 TRINITY_DN3199_c0_g1~~TRINITY_DN3199_c0_g1_i2.p1  ORF type:complete len:199 (+),score=24.60 TRINITY_DN3199_c0_g1_i2:39-599(+)
MMGEHARLSHGNSKALYGAAGDEAASKHFCARWGCAQWTLMLIFMLLGKALIGFSIACCLRFKGFNGTSEEKKTFLAYAALAVFGACFIFVGLGANAPTMLRFERDDEKCALHFHRRLRNPICRDLKDVAGILEMGWVAAQGFASVGFATGTPSWELIFQDGDSWMFTLQDHEGFLKHLSQGRRVL